MGDTSRITRRTFLQWTALSCFASISRESWAQGRPVSGSASQRRLVDGWEFHQGALGGPWDVWRSDKSNNLPWQSVPLPHCFNTRDCVDPDVMYYQGPGWYKTAVKVSNPFPDGRTLLLFEGAGQKSEVFVYLERVGQHVGGYDEFKIDITDAAGRTPAAALRNGELPIAIMCDNSRDLEMIPSALNDFTRFGGLYRNVDLVYVPALSLERLHIDSRVRPNGAASISVKARLYNPSSVVTPAEISVRAFDPGGSNICSVTKSLLPWGGEREVAAFEVAAPQLWMPAKPALYRCEVTLNSAHGAMTVRERFGIRYFELVDHGPFKLNGERLFLRGTQRAEDHARVGAAMTDDLISKELRLIKEMGTNFIRLGHYQQSRLVLDLCDELGLLVWEEIPWSRGGLGGEHYRQQARDMLRAMIDQHYNHPSIIFWGLGNENDWPGDFPEYEKDRVAAFVQELHEEAHRLDPSRKTGLRRCDFAKDVPDIYSPSLWAGWYGGRYTEYQNQTREAAQTVKHFIHMEWGGDSHAGRHSEEVEMLVAKSLSPDASDPHGREYLLTGGQSRASVEGDWSETYLCNLVDWYLKEQESMQWMMGAAQWAFKDFSTPVRTENPVPHVNQKGLVDRDLNPKEAFYVFQAYWAEKPMVHIYGHSWPIRWGSVDEAKLVKVYSNCDEAELFVNGAPCGGRKRNPQNFPAAGLHWLVTFSSGRNLLRAVAKKNSQVVTDEIQFIYQTEKWGAPTRLDLREIARASGIVTVEARLVDGNGVICLDARDRVRFGLTGDGALIDDLGTTTGSRLVEACNGRAQISIATKNGSSMASVSSKLLPTAFFLVQ
jgi:beta-galactosidase